MLCGVPERCQEKSSEGALCKHVTLMLIAVRQQGRSVRRCEVAIDDIRKEAPLFERPGFH